LASKLTPLQHATHLQRPYSSSANIPTPKRSEMPPFKRPNPFLDVTENAPANSPKNAKLIGSELPARSTSTNTRLPRPSNLQTSTGQQDTHLTLGQIHNGDSVALINQLVEIQKATLPRDESEEWAANLRYLHVEDLGQCRQLQHITLTQKGEYKERVDYIAVSYRWQYPSEPEPNPVYLIFDGNKEPRGNKAPNAVLTRAIACAQRLKIPFIWIDQECIPSLEDNPEEHRVAIQAMDIVYKRSDYPLGLLNITLHPEQFGILYQLLMTETTTDEATRMERLVWNPTDDEISLTHEVLSEILKDEWWDRAWIL
jgi:hypothetical protein